MSEELIKKALISYYSKDAKDRDSSSLQPLIGDQDYERLNKICIKSNDTLETIVKVTAGFEPSIATPYQVKECLI